MSEISTRKEVGIFGDETAIVEVRNPPLNQVDAQITIRAFTLRQIDLIKGLIFDFYQKGIENKTFTSEVAGQAATTTSYDEHSWRQSFFMTEDVIGRFLDHCVEVEVRTNQGDRTKADVRDLPLSLMMTVFEEAFALNDDFFRRFMAFATKAEDFFQRFQKRNATTQVGETAEADQIPMEAEGPLELDLTQAGSPVGQRSPLLSVQRES